MQLILEIFISKSLLCDYNKSDNHIFFPQFGIVDGAYILPPILYPDGNYYLKIGHYNQFETNLNSDMKTITDWYKQGTGLPEAVKHFTDFITKELIVDPNIEFGEISSDCCVTVNVSIKH